MKPKEVEIDGKIITVYIGDDRKYRVRIECVRCGKESFPILSRVKNGQGRFCSVECANLYEQEHARFGKEHAYFYWDEKRQIWYAFWYVSSKKQNSTTKARWLWEMNYGDLPSNQIVTFIDGNPKNCELDNLKVISRAESNKIHLVGHVVTDEAKKNMSDARQGMKLSDTHKQNISDSLYKRWSSGEFDSIHCGENNKHWRGGVDGKYNKEFRKIRKQIIDRDKNKCRICGARVSRMEVHHIDANKENNSLDNLITLCLSCHHRIHDYQNKNEKDPVILAFRSMIPYD